MRRRRGTRVEKVPRLLKPGPRRLGCAARRKEGRAVQEAAIQGLRGSPASWRRGRRRREGCGRLRRARARCQNTGGEARKRGACRARGGRNGRPAPLARGRDLPLRKAFVSASTEHRPEAPAARELVPVLDPLARRAGRCSGQDREARPCSARRGRGGGGPRRGKRRGLAETGTARRCGGTSLEGFASLPCAEQGGETANLEAESRSSRKRGPRLMRGPLAPRGMERGRPLRIVHRAALSSGQAARGRRGRSASRASLVAEVVHGRVADRPSWGAIVRPQGSAVRGLLGGDRNPE